MPREYTSPRVQLWMGPDAHLVAYPISGARQINVVAVVPGTWNRPGWSAPGEASEIKKAFASSRWPGTARMMIGAVDEWRKWALFTLPDGGEWSRWRDRTAGRCRRTRCCRLPRKARAWRSRMPRCSPNALATAPAKTPAGIAAALKRYARLRRARVARVQRTARRNGRIYHLTGPAALARDLAIKAMGPKPHAGAAGLDLRLAGVKREGALGVVGVETVIASEAKQSMGPQSRSGLLRRFAPRNDVENFKYDSAISRRDLPEFC